MNNNRLRVLHAPIVAMYAPVEAIKGLRRLGHKADYMVFDDSGDGWLCNREWDINLNLNNQNLRQRFGTLFRFLSYAVARYDIFHFHSGRTLIPLVEHSRWSFIPEKLKTRFSFLDYIDLPLLKMMGKKIVFQFWGCDIRPREKDVRFDYSCCRDCSDEMLTHCTNGHKEKMHAMVMKYGDLLLGSGDLAVTVPQLTWINNAIDTTVFKPEPHHKIPADFKLPQNGKIWIYHTHYNAEDRGDVKGTSHIRRAVEELNREGFNVELIHYSCLPREKLRYYQCQADIVVDQLRCGAYGSTAVECMACGKPVICYIREEVRQKYPGDLPIIQADQHTVKDKLRKLIVSRNMRETVGKKSRVYAETYHDRMAVSKNLEQLYARL